MIKYITFCLLLAGIYCSNKAVKNTDEKPQTPTRDNGFENPDDGVTVPVENHFTYCNEKRLEKSKKMIDKEDTYYTEAYSTLISKAEKDLDMKANPVTNKTMVPPSGDKHDYLSLAPYWWPDPSKSDGLPWIRKDGEVNPLTRGDNTDQTRLSDMFSAVDKLSFAYYFSGDKKYADKAMEIIKIWFLDDATKVNPNIKYGQGVPGSNDGRPAGVIEWVGISDIVTAIEILNQDHLIKASDKTKLDAWMKDYVTWLQTSEIGKNEDSHTNNHGNWYDYIVIGIQSYLGEKQTSKERLEVAKTKRIALQIEPDGSQPNELSRTKSINYSTMNLRAMLKVAEIGKYQGIDLLNYKTEDGRSLKKALDYFKPYISRQKIWRYKQITSGGVEKAIKYTLKPMLSMAEVIYNEDIFGADAKVSEKIDYMQKLLYPPVEK